MYRDMASEVVQYTAEFAFVQTFSVYRIVVLPAAPRPSITHLRYCFFGPPPNHDTGCCKGEEDVDIEEEDMIAAPMMMMNNDKRKIKSEKLLYCGGHAV
jgi:hypothetical protein